MLRVSRLLLLLDVASHLAMQPVDGRRKSEIQISTCLWLQVCEVELRVLDTETIESPTLLESEISQVLVVVIMKL